MNKKKLNYNTNNMILHFKINRLFPRIIEAVLLLWILTIVRIFRYAEALSASASNMTSFFCTVLVVMGVPEVLAFCKLNVEKRIESKRWIGNRRSFYLPDIPIQISRFPL